MYIAQHECKNTEFGWIFNIKCRRFMCIATNIRYMLSLVHVSIDNDSFRKKYTL